MKRTRKDLLAENRHLRLEVDYWKGYTAAMRERLAEVERERKRLEVLVPNPTWPTIPTEPWRINCINGLPEVTR